MKKIKHIYWYFLLLVFIVVYFGAFLFFRSTVDGRLSFFGDIINAFGTFIGVLVAYFIMQKEILNNKRDKLDENEFNILLILDEEFDAVHETELMIQLETFKMISEVPKAAKGMNYIKSQVIDHEKMYKEIDGYVKTMISNVKHLPKRNELFDAVQSFSAAWKRFYIDGITITIPSVTYATIYRHLPNVDSSVINADVIELLKADKELEKQISQYWNYRAENND